MTIRNPVQTGERAFTLLELLVALAISAIVLSVVTTVYFSALQLDNRTTESFDDALPLQRTLAVMKRDLAATLPPGGVLVGDFQSTPTTDSSSSMNLVANGRQVSPFIYTASGVIDDYTPFGDVQKVSYYLVPPTNNAANGYDLIRVLSRNLLPVNTGEVTSQWLMGGVEDVRLQYFDGNNWMETWDSTVSSNLPAAVKIQVIPAAEPNQANEYLRRPIEMVVPLLVQSRTNQTRQTQGGG